MTYRIFVHFLNCFLDTDYDTAADAFRSAQLTLRTGRHFSIHPVLDDCQYAAVLDGIAP